jgi:hypothetical protein
MFNNLERKFIKRPRRTTKRTTKRINLSPFTKDSTIYFIILTGDFLTTFKIAEFNLMLEAAAIIFIFTKNTNISASSKIICPNVIYIGYGCDKKGRKAISCI